MKFKILIIILLLLGCSKSGDGTRPAPINIDRTHACATCGMIVVDQTGPKAEILYDKDKMAAFCSLSDMFIFYLQPDRPINIRAIYAQELSDDAKTPATWIDGESAYYVYGKEIIGHMGMTLIPFKDESKAKDYAAKNKGNITRIDRVTLSMIGLNE
jgi:copper chaperone NosL